MDMDSSYDIWSWRHLPKGQGGPPNRRSHERHLRKLKKFLNDNNGMPLVDEVEKKREKMDWPELDLPPSIPYKDNLWRCETPSRPGSMQMIANADCLLGSCIVHHDLQLSASNSLVLEEQFRFYLVRMLCPILFQTDGYGKAVPKVQCSLGADERTPSVGCTHAAEGKGLPLSSLIV